MSRDDNLRLFNVSLVPQLLLSLGFLLTLVHRTWTTDPLYC